MTRTSHAHIYVAVAPLQLLAIAAILRNRAPETHSHDHICFVFSRGEPAFKPPHCRLIQYNTQGLWPLCRAVRRFGVELRRIQARYAALSVYLPHPYHLPTNYLLFGLPNRSAYLIPDGLLNYYDRRIRFRQFVPMLAKSVLALGLGLWYRPYTGHLTAYEQKVYQGVYTFNPEGLLTDTGQLRRISLGTGLRPGSTDSSAKACLVLDQDIESVVKAADARRMRAVLRDYLQAGGFETLYYKGHPSRVGGQPLGDGPGLAPVRTISSPLPVELLIPDYGPAEVVSFFSSALLNIRDLYPSIRCTAIGMNAFLASGDSRLKGLFIRRGIRLIDI